MEFRQRYMALALLCVGCGGDSFSANEREAASDGGLGDKPAVGVTSDDASSVESSGGAAVDSPEDGGGSDLDGASGTTGDASGVDGAGGSGGSNIEDAGGCELVTHDNGLGQTWQDCEPLYTFNLDQALKACEASSATACFGTERCGVGEVRGLIGDAGAFFAEWGYEGFAAGLVAPDYNLCGGPSAPNIQRWR